MVFDTTIYFCNINFLSQATFFSGLIYHPRDILLSNKRSRKESYAPVVTSSLITDIATIVVLTSSDTY